MEMKKRKKSHCLLALRNRATKLYLEVNFWNRIAMFLFESNRVLNKKTLTAKAVKNGLPISPKSLSVFAFLFSVLSYLSVEKVATFSRTFRKFVVSVRGAGRRDKLQIHFSAWKLLLLSFRLSFPPSSFLSLLPIFPFFLPSFPHAVFSVKKVAIFFLYLLQGGEEG